MNYKVEKDFIVEGFRCVIIGNYMGHRCGYVEIPKGHILYEKHYADEELYDIDVHGDWTYSEFGGSYPVESTKDSWWIGFDCAHYGDACDVELVRVLGGEEYVNNQLFVLRQKYGVIRTTEYVENELRGAVKQIINLPITEENN